jgi:hypothetical protein
VGGSYAFRRRSARAALNVAQAAPEVRRQDSGAAGPQASLGKVPVAKAEDCDCGSGAVGSKAKSDVAIQTTIPKDDKFPGMKSRQTIAIDYEKKSVTCGYVSGVTDIGIFEIPAARSSFSVSNIYFIGSDKVLFTAVGETASGVRVLPNINYRFKLIISKDGDAKVDGGHDAYPAYTVTVGGVQKYHFEPEPGNLGGLWGDSETKVKKDAPKDSQSKPAKGKDR